MNTKIYLTSFIALSFALPAMAAPSHTGEFPSGGLMLEDYTYTNAAIADNMDGVYEGTVNANAQYTDIEYTIPAGKYLPANGEEVIDCNVSGSFCPGVPGTVTYTGAAQGLTSCSSATNGDYTLSDGTGSTADTCYRTCSGNVTIEHATGVTGNDYYGNGVDTCAPTGCDNGWHVKSEIRDLTTMIGRGQGSDYAYIDDAGTFHGNNLRYSIKDKNTWAVDYGNNGILEGQARCSTQPGNNGWYTNGIYDSNGDWSNTATFTTADLGEESGTYCYCNVTKYKPKDGISQNVSSLWGFYVNDNSCNTHCAENCALNAMNNYGNNQLSFRAAVLDTVADSPASCEANTITINWGDTDSTDVTANDAGTCTYGGNINTPFKAQHKNGKRFVGWTFSKPSGN